jgi:lysozyme
MEISKNGIDFIKSFEKFVNKPYLDVANFWTIGFGHKILHTDEFYPYGIKTDITLSEANDLFLKDLFPVEVMLNNKFENITLTQNQYDALCSLIYNIGIGNFLSSTMYNYLDNQDFKSAATEFMRWKYSNGYEIQGLKNRRLREMNIFMS